MPVQTVLGIILGGGAGSRLHPLAHFRVLHAPPDIRRILTPAQTVLGIILGGGARAPGCTL